MTLARILLGASACITLLLGSAHLYLTFFTRAFNPRDPALEERLRKVSPILTAQTTLWRSQIGFHVSHSMGPLLFGALYLYFGIEQPALFFHSAFLMALGAVVLLSYLALAKLYWFQRPLRGLLLASILYIAGVVTGCLSAG
jgi:hypothetical protein